MAPAKKRVAAKKPSPADTKVPRMPHGVLTPALSSGSVRLHVTGQIKLLNSWVDLPPEMAAAMVAQSAHADAPAEGHLPGEALSLIHI